MLHSLRAQLLVFTLSITLLVFTLLMFISFTTLRSLQNHNMKETAYANLKITTDSIDRNIDLLFKMINWFSLNNDIQAFLNSREKYPNDMRFKAIGSYNVIRNSVYSNGLSSYINKIIIGNLKGYSVQFGNVEGHSTDYRIAREILTRSGSAPVSDPFYHSENQLVIPIYQAILDQSLESGDPRKTIGHIYATVNSSIITQMIELNRIDPQISFLVCIEETIYKIENDRLISCSGVTPILLKTKLESDGNRRQNEYPYIPSVSINSENTHNDYVIYQGPVSGWIFLQSVPRVERQWEKAVYTRLFVLIALIMLGMVTILTIIIDKTINHPLAQVGQRIKQISAGDFSVDSSIEFRNEIGYIGQGINHMVKEIDQLINDKIDHEKTKRDLEFRILQSQINPHFLYNTLNSIKWMATIQKSEGIAEMVSSLAVLLRHLAKGTEEKITLEKELNLIEEYCRIQNYRSAGKLSLEFDIEDETLLKAGINQFTLQPLVENAIFHGLEPKQVPGTIRIEVKQADQGCVLVVIQDDGIGIASDRIPGLLEENSHSGKSMNHIGLKNVDERIKMSFGAEYGLSIESQMGKYTRINVLFPVEELTKGE